MKKFIAIVLFVLCCAGTASAYVVVQNHPIDIAIEEKIDENGSNFGMIEAYEWGIQEWDKLLNQNYQALMKKLKKGDQERLRASQREWIKYRDLEFKFNTEYWAGFKGSMYLPFPFAYQSNFIRERALRLGYYLEDLEAL
jgi:uncharacterized protein YecT (DUF1311 family)